VAGLALYRFLLKEFNFSARVTLAFDLSIAPTSGFVDRDRLRGMSNRETDLRM
jgi:hypothetical protein